MHNAHAARTTNIYAAALATAHAITDAEWLTWEGGQEFTNGDRPLYGTTHGGGFVMVDLMGVEIGLRSGDEMYFWNVQFTMDYPSAEAARTAAAAILERVPGFTAATLEAAGWMLVGQCNGL